MNNKTNQPGKGKKLLLVVPLIALPFLALLFWAMGGGKGLNGSINEKKEGLNATLPDARVPDDSAMDKMGFYDQEEKASGSSETYQPNEDTAELLEGVNASDLSGKNNMNQYNDYAYTGQSSTGWNNSTVYSEKAIRQKMAELEASMRGKEQPLTSSQAADAVPPYAEKDIEKQLTSLTVAANEQDSSDPEMDQLQTVMDRIYEIQHPDEVAHRLQQQSAANRGTVFPVGSVPSPEIIHFLSKKENGQDSSGRSSIEKKSNGFYGLASITRTEQTVGEGIAAVVQENTTVVNGASIRLRLLQAIYINGIHVPAGNFVTGQAQLSNDRVGITIPTILYNQHILPVKLSVYDTDGMEGLYVPGSINRDVVKQSGDNAIQGVGVGTLDPSLGAQAAAAGIETAKTLFSRKLKLTKVFIKAGHQLILKDNQ